MKRLIYSMGRMSLAYLLLVLLLPFENIQAENTFEVNQILGDGAHGRVYRQWKQTLPERGIRSVQVRIERQSGNEETFVNLRFGRGKTFENGKREYLRNNQLVTLRWELGGAVPNGEELVLSVYNGEAVLRAVQVQFVGDPDRNSATAQPVGEAPSDDELAEQAVSEAQHEVIENCKQMSETRTRKPSIEIDAIRPAGSLFSGKYRIEGAIFASCVEEAGYYEFGKLKEPIRFPLQERARRKEFTVNVRSGREGEIRVYTVDGRKETLAVDEEIDVLRPGF